MEQGNKTKIIGCFTLFVGFLICLLVSAIIFSYLISEVAENVAGSVRIDIDKERFEEIIIEKPKASTSDKIAHIDLEGMISSAQVRGGGSMVQRLKKVLRYAAADTAVKAIVLRINSPGGEVTASDVIYNEIKKIREKKPVVVYMDAIAASGGYYIACGADYIVANETTITGSIGVIVSTFNIQEALHKVGIKPVVFKSGEFKDTLSMMREMSEEEKAYMQTHVTQVYGKFLGIVEKSRGLTEEYLKNQIADGRIFTGKEAVKKRLIDQTGYIEDAYEIARQRAKSPHAGVIKYLPTFSLTDFLGFLSKSAEKNTVQIEVFDHLLTKLKPGYLYFLPSYYLLNE